MAMQSFTMGTTDMVTAMVDNLPDKYEMTLNRGDMEALLWVLGSIVGFYNPGDLTEEIEERAVSLFSSFATTLDIEGV